MPSKGWENVAKLASHYSLGADDFGPVDLVISELTSSRNWKVAGQVLYHTSIVVHGKEYFFGAEGMKANPLGERFVTPPSHLDKQNCMIFEVGHTRKTADELVRTLEPRFRRDSYDLVAKNCN